MTPLAIAIIAYVGGALTMYAAQRISEAARHYPDPRIQPPRYADTVQTSTRVRWAEHDPRLN